MQSCLGLYIENNLIKYAKISKEKENFRIESFRHEILRQHRRNNKASY